MLHAALLAAAALAFAAVPSPAAATDVLYVANRSSDNLGMFTLSGGALTAQASSPFAVGHLPVDVVTSPDGHRVFVGNGIDGTVGVYDVGTDGGLTPVAGSPFPGAGGGVLRLSPDGTRLFVGTNSAIHVFDVASSGALTEIAGSPFVTGASGTIVELDMTPDGRYLYAAVFNFGNFSGFSVAANGSLTELAGSPYASGANPSGVAVDPQGKHLYLLNGGGYFTTDVTVYDIDSDGELTQQPGPVATAGGYSAALALSPDGTHLHVANSDDANISTFEVASDGSLSDQALTSAGDSPNDLAISPDGRYMYATNFGAATVSAFTIGTGGAPSPLGSPVDSGGVEPSAVALGSTPAPPPDPPAMQPKTKIKGKPKYEQSENTRFRFGSSVEGSTFKCKLDRARYRDCRSPKNYKHLKAGKHTFRVYAISPDGAADASPAKVKFKVKASKHGRKHKG